MCHGCTPNSELQGKSRNVYVFGLTLFMNDTASEMAYWILPAFLVPFYLSAGLAALAAALVANSETKSPKLPE